MAWPNSQDYNEAVQSPSISFSDPDLQRGEAATNALGLPMPRSGNFADVYEFRTPEGRWAVKCFTRETPNLCERYSKIGEHLRQAKLPFLVDFQFQEQGIRIRGQWYPILKMQWVDGQLLNEIVRNNLDKPHVLDGLLTIWRRMAVRLRESGICHGDLQHGNVILVPGERANTLAVKLVDYDGMWIPSLAALPSSELGHSSFQHPARAKGRLYSVDLDKFPLLTIATALRAVRLGGAALWNKHDNGDNLLFRESDFQNPGASSVFSDIVDLNDEALSTMTRGVIASLALPPSQTPWLEGPAQTRVETSAPTRVDAGSRPASKAPAPRSPAADSLAFDTTPAPRTDAQPKASPGAPAGRKIPLAWILGGAGVAALALIGLLVVMLSGSDDSKQASRAAKKEKPSQPEAVAKPPAPKPAPPPPPAVVQAARIEVEMSAGQSKRLSIPIARSGAGSRASGTIEGVSFPPFVQCTSGTIGPADTEREVTLTVAPKTPLTGPEKVSGKVVVTLGGQVIETPVLLTLLPAVAAAPEIDPNAIANPIRKLPEGETFSIGVVYQANQTVRAVVAFSGANTADTKLSVVRVDGQFVPFGETPGTLTFAALPNVPYRILVANRSKLPFDGVLHVTAPVMALAKVDPARPPDPPPVDPVPPKPKEPEVKPKEPAPPKDPPGFPQEKEYVNAVGMKFMRVSAGTFLMGATHEEAKAFAVLKPLPTVFPEEPRHQVEISKDFYIGAHEVTQAQYQAVTGVNPSKFQDDPKLPVHNLKWSDAKRFCDKLSAQEGKIYRLPTEAEWEYACRAGTSTPFNVGKALFLTQARVASAISSKGTPPVRVGGYEANKWGLHDMHGNVWEYCEDHYHPTFYKNSPEKDPVNGWGTELHVLRGGSAGHDARFARSACRAWEVSGADISYNGFRVVLASASLAPSAPMVAEGPRFGGPQPPVGAGIRVLAEAAQLGAAVPTRNYPIRMLAGKTYVIAMNSGDFDAYLQLVGPVGNILARDDDSGGGRNARITYRCLKTGDYGVVARRFSEAGGGGFTLDVYER